MSIIKINPSNVQNYKIVTNPRRLFTSSSDEGVEGDVQLFADASPRLKDIDPSFAEDKYDSLGIEKLRTDVLQGIGAGTTVPGIEQYLNAVNQHPQGERQQKRQEVLRYEPGVKHDKNFLSKRAIKESLFKYYKPDYNTLDWAYTNYHSLNFFRLRGTETVPGGGTTITPATLDIDFNINLFFPTIFPLTITNNSSTYSVVWIVRFNQMSLISNASLVSGVLTINTNIPGSGPPWTLNGLITSFNNAVTAAVGVAGKVVLTTSDLNPNNDIFASRFDSETYNVPSASEITSPSIQPISNDGALIYRAPSSELQNYIASKISGNLTIILSFNPTTSPLSLQLLLKNYTTDTVLIFWTVSSMYNLTYPSRYQINVLGNPAPGSIKQININFYLGLDANPSNNIFSVVNFIADLEAEVNSKWGSGSFEVTTSYVNSTITITSSSNINAISDMIPKGILNQVYKGHYAPSDVFTFDFWLKPRTPQNVPNEPVSPGTILHMSSCYAISIATSSLLGLDGYVDYHRLVLQFSQSAEIPPNSISVNNEGNINFSSEVLGSMTQSQFALTKGKNIWTSKPSLKDNYWNHISVRWPGGFSNGGTGSIWINGNLDTYISSSEISLMHPFFESVNINEPDALFVGNFYEGSNNGLSAIQRFFNLNTAEKEGLTPYLAYDSDPSGFKLRHSLWGEVHDIKIYNKYKLDHEVLNIMRNGRSNIEEGLLFCLPPFFTKETRTRQILQTPFFSAMGSTNDPFNVSLSFGVGGFETNLENFVKEFVTNEYPRLYKMTSSLQEDAVPEPLTANDIMYGEQYGRGCNRRRIYSVLPNDNGRFFPRYELLNTGADGESKFVDSFGARRMDLISLEDMVSTASLIMGPQTVSNLSAAGGTTLFQEIEGASPEDPGVAPGSVLTVLRRTGDPSSNELVIFDISNMFYGDRILPKSLVMRDNDPIYIDAELRFTIRDDGRGSLYRADAESKHAEWNNVGNVLYEEGLIVIKSPALRMFGKEGYTIEFRGERNIYVLEFSIPLERNELNVSSNSTYKDMRPTENANETAERFVYVTGINLHDDNLNVVARANMSQAVVKRDNDRMVVKLRMDF